MEWLVENWYMLFSVVAVTLMVAFTIARFFKLPTAQQIANIKEWLKLAVVTAEKELGSGTGQLKLRMVYDMAIQHFPWVAKMVKFETFSGWVDEALEWMEGQLINNREIYKLVKESKND